MSFRSERFNASMRSLDRMLGGRDPSKCALLGDNGAAVERMLDEIDSTPEQIEAEERALRSERARRIIAAEKRLAAIGKAWLVPTLRLIIENGSNREESIWSMMKN